MHDAVTRSVSPWLLVALLLALISAWPRAARAQDQPSRETTVLRAARILDGRGEVLEDRDLVVRDGVVARFEN